MKKSNNLILNAVLSKLQSERDEVLAKIDLIVNKEKISNVNSVVDDAINLFKQLNNLDGTLELMDIVIEQNSDVKQAKEKIEEIGNIISKLNETQQTQENNGDNS